MTVSALDEFQSFDNDVGRRAVQIRDFTMEFQNAISSTERCPVPVIVAVHGIAYGLPVDIMGACDVRYASTDATFSIKVSGNLSCGSSTLVLTRSFVWCLLLG